jgi:hypothetical protein
LGRNDFGYNWGSGGKLSRGQAERPATKGDGELITTRNQLSKLGAYSVVQDSQQRVYQLHPADKSTWAKWLTPGSTTALNYADIPLPAVLLKPA